MTSRSIDQLTEAQRECLRLVLSHHSSKEIAIKLGISPHSVNKRIERAVTILGASSRFDAARQLEMHEGATYDRIVHDQIDVAADALFPAPKQSTEPWGLGRRLIGLSSGERSYLNARNSLSKLQRATLVLGLMVGIAVASGALLNIAGTLSSVFWRYGIDLSR